MKKIIHFVHIHAPSDKAYWALAAQEGLAGWWSKRVQAAKKVGGVVRFQFLEGFNPEMEITALEENRRVEWKCVGGHDNWRDNTFVFDIRSAGNESKLMFVQHYAQELGDEVYGTYNFNWGYYLGSLKQLCETGSGTPFEREL